MTVDMEAMLARRHTMRIEPARTMQAGGFDWPHTIEVALPPSYDHSGESYPVLWILDGSGYFRAAADVVNWLAVAGRVRDMIVVGVGCDRDATAGEYARRRTFDFTPSDEPFFDGLGGKRLRAMTEAMGLQMQHGGAPGFLNFLVDDVRPKLEADYRMDKAEHALFGHSGGGLFAAYALFARTGAFKRIICGSPSLNSGNFEVFRLEEEYAAAHKDLAVHLFLGAGEDELDDGTNAMWSLVGSMIRLSETLRLRGYPSLALTTRVFPGESHNSLAWPLLTRGLQAVWS